MVRYIHKFRTESEFQTARKDGYSEPWVSLTVESDNRVDYNKTEDEKLLEKPFTFEALGPGTLSWSLPADIQFEYSKNGGSWTATGDLLEIELVEGDEVAFKGINTEYSFSFQNSISCTASFNVKGNIMSLVYGDGFETASTLTVESQFGGLFYGCDTLVSAGGLQLPATALASSCYNSMFGGCTSLTQAPALPATTLADYCYSQMFYGCTSLTTAPELPATTMAYGCYNSMFQECTGLTQAPALPATTLAGDCYYSMFQDCTSLTNAPVLPATTLDDECYKSMFNGCTSLTQAPALPATTLVNSCYYSMFHGCTGLTQAPVLPATTLAGNCYQEMFSGCTSLNYIKAMFTTTPGAGYTSNWVSGVAASGTFVKNSAAGWDVSGVHGIPDNWTVETVSS